MTRVPRGKGAKGGRKNEPLMGTYALAPKVNFQTENTRAIDDVVDSLDTLPRVYDSAAEQVVAMSEKKPQVRTPSLDRSMGIIQSSDREFQNSGVLLMSDPRLRGVPNIRTQTDIAREIGRMMYYPGIDRMAVSRLGALMQLKARLSDASLGANLRNEPFRFSGMIDRINREVDNIIDQVNLRSQPEIIRRIEGLNTSIGIRTATVRAQAKAYRDATTQRERLAAIKDIAEQGLG